VTVLMLNNTQEILFLVARDFVQLTPLQQINIGIRLEVCGVDAAMLAHEKLPEMIFKMAYERGKIRELVTEMRQYLYE
jgi:hypothetical protein